MMKVVKNSTYETNYFQKHVDSLSDEIERLRRTLRPLEEQLRKFPNSRPLRETVDSKRARIKELDDKRHQYLYRLNK